MATPLLTALLSNESGGRNVANTDATTSSGQAQGYFQITTGTWRDFAQKAGIDLARYPNPMTAADGTPVPYEIQAQVASVIPVNRWDESTVAKMKATGVPVDPNKTLGENLAAAGENIKGQPRVSGPVEAAGGGFGSDKGAPQLYTPPPEAAPAPAQTPLSAAADVATLQQNDPWSNLASGLAASVGSSGGGGAAPSSLPSLPPIDLPITSAVPPITAPAAPSAGDTGSLADLFKLGDFGQAPALNTGVGGRSARTRQYG